MSTLPESIYTMPDGDLIRLRQAREADLPGMEWDGEYAHFRRLYRQHYQNSRSGNTLIWVAENQDGKIIGQVFLLLLSAYPEMADGIHRAYMFSFRIRSEYRNNGLGGHVIRFLEEYLLGRGFDTMRINVGRANEQARKLYEKHGYRIIGTEEGRWRYQDQFGNWQIVNEPAWRMIKKLSPEVESREQDSGSG